MDLEPVRLRWQASKTGKVIVSLAVLAACFY